jgi:hypothetical protein
LPRLPLPKSLLPKLLLSPPLKLLPPKPLPLPLHKLPPLKPPPPLPHKLPPLLLKRFPPVALLRKRAASWRRCPDSSKTYKIL